MSIDMLNNPPSVMKSGLSASTVANQVASGIWGDAGWEIRTNLNKYGYSYIEVMLDVQKIKIQGGTR